MKYRRAVERDLPAIAEINLACVPTGLRAAMGAELTTEFFRCFYKDGGPFVVAEEQGVLAGYVMGYYQGCTAKQRFEKENAARIETSLQKAATGGNATAQRFFAEKAQSALSVCLHPEAGYGSVLLSLSILPAHSGRGMAKKILSFFLQTLQADERAVDNCVKTQTDNFAAQRVYTACDYTEIFRNDVSVWYGRDLK